jgi:hypothetical protein
VLPFQMIEKADEPQAKKTEKLQMDLFDRLLELKSTFKECMPIRRKVE